MKNRGVEYSSVGHSLRLLIVEDDPIIRRVLERFSMRKAWKVVLAEDGKVALDAFRNQEFDVIIMDCHVPILDGYQTTREIRQIESQRGTHTPIIALTANDLAGVREACLNAGMDDYLTKPVELNAFYTIVDQWAGKRLGK